MVHKGKLLTILTCWMVCAIATSVHAGGFSSSLWQPTRSVSAKALANNYSVLKSRSGKVTTNNYAKVTHQTINGQILKGRAEAGNKVSVMIDGRVCNTSCRNGRVVVSQKSKANTKIYIKNKNMLAKASARNHLRIEVDGELKFDSEEYTYAMGRFTPLGTQMRSGGSSHNRLEAKGLVRLKTGQIAVSTATIGK